MQKKRCCANIYRRGFPFQIACAYRVCRYKWVSSFLLSGGQEKGAVQYLRGSDIQYTEAHTRIRICLAAMLQGRKEGPESLVILFAMTFARLAKYECTYMKGGTGILRRRAMSMAINLSVSFEKLNICTLQHV
jgi:hypothetical protein